VNKKLQGMRRDAVVV